MVAELQNVYEFNFNNDHQALILCTHHKHVIDFF
jgi:hypothetical protein